MKIKSGGLRITLIDDRTQQNIPLAQLMIPHVVADIGKVQKKKKRKKKSNLNLKQKKKPDKNTNKQINRSQLKSMDL